jgi:hypothetical protein
MLQILGIHRSEVAHCAFLGWLFGGIDSMQVRSSMVKGLLNCLSTTQRVGHQETSKNPDELPLPTYMKTTVQISFLELTHIQATTEEPMFSGEKKGRIDLLIRCSFGAGSATKNFAIVVESKIKAFEQGDQTKKYFDWAESQKSDPNFGDPIYVFLTPENLGRDYKATTAACPAFFAINFQDLYEFCLRPALALLELEGRSRELLFLREFVRNLEAVEDLENNPGGIMSRANILAATHEDRIACQEFMEKFGGVIRQIVSTAYPKDPLLEEIDKGLFKRKRSEVDLEDLIKDGSIKADDKLYFDYSKEICGDLVQIAFSKDEGRAKLLWSGQTFDSLNAAGKAILIEKSKRDNPTLNAWDKFRLLNAQGAKLSELRDLLTKQKA